ncbi:DUF6113 family protein [Sphaerimonospora cavernae]|uniref:DUF6113 family protein n=1 Tax=Sphaerimonospora cavernae TaxID=1740611 RepID=A0ABV6UCA9_9ACTN
MRAHKREETSGTSGAESHRLDHVPGRDFDDDGVMGPLSSPLSGPLTAVVTGAAYGVLFLLGIALGVVGGFQHSWYMGEAPVAALAWLVILFAVPYGMGRLMGGKAGALVPAAGWLASSFLLAAKQRAGDLVIAGDVSGFWYLYGGVVAVAAAVIATRSSGSWLLRSYERT